MPLQRILVVSTFESVVVCGTDRPLVCAVREKLVLDVSGRNGLCRKFVGQDSLPLQITGRDSKRQAKTCSCVGQARVLANSLVLSLAKRAVVFLQLFGIVTDNFSFPARSQAFHGLGPGRWWLLQSNW